VDEAFQAFGPTNIEEVVTLANRGNGYTGSFRLTQYVNDGSKTPINDATGAPVAFVIVGRVRRRNAFSSFSYPHLCPASLRPSRALG
jgi:hypothetical protein